MSHLNVIIASDSPTSTSLQLDIQDKAMIGNIPQTCLRTYPEFYVRQMGLRFVPLNPF